MHAWNLPNYLYIFLEFHIDSHFFPFSLKSNLTIALNFVFCDPVSRRFHNPLYSIRHCLFLFIQLLPWDLNAYWAVRYTNNNSINTKGSTFFPLEHHRMCRFNSQWAICVCCMANDITTSIHKYLIYKFSMWGRDFMDDALARKKTERNIHIVLFGMCSKSKLHAHLQQIGIGLYCWDLEVTYWLFTTLPFWSCRTCT